MSFVWRPGQKAIDMMGMEEAEVKVQAVCDFCLSGSPGTEKQTLDRSCASLSCQASGSLRRSGCHKSGLPWTC